MGKIEGRKSKVKGRKSKVDGLRSKVGCPICCTLFLVPSHAVSVHAERSEASENVCLTIFMPTYSDPSYRQDYRDSINLLLVFSGH